MIPKNINLSKFCAATLALVIISGCEAQDKQVAAETKQVGEKKLKIAKVDSFEHVSDRLIAGEKIPLDQLVKQLEKRTWEQLQPILLASIKKRSVQPNWTKEAQKKAMAGYSRVRLIFSKRRRNQSLEELENAIQQALKNERLMKRQ